MEKFLQNLILEQKRKKHLQQIDDVVGRVMGETSTAKKVCGKKTTGKERKSGVKMEGAF